MYTQFSLAGCLVLSWWSGYSAVLHTVTEILGSNTSRDLPLSVSGCHCCRDGMALAQCSSACATCAAFSARTGTSVKVGKPVTVSHFCVFFHCTLSHDDLTGYMLAGQCWLVAITEVSLVIPCRQDSCYAHWVCCMVFLWQDCSVDAGSCHTLSIPGLLYE